MKSLAACPICGHTAEFQMPSADDARDLRLAELLLGAVLRRVCDHRTETNDA